MADNIRKRAVVKGRVQMVFYRHTTCLKAAELGARGWVMNRADGNVELVAEGPAEAVEGLIEWCRTGPPNAEVTGLKVSDEPYTGEFESFDTRYA